MLGDIIKVERKRLRLGQSYKERRRTDHHGFIDHIINRSFSFVHYGIEVEDGMVIHFVINTIHRPSDCIVEKVPLSTFLKDGELAYEENVHYAFPREEIVRRAEQYLESDFEGYRLHNNNCEHFARYCATGEKVAMQSKWLTLYRSLSKAPKKTAHYSKKAGHGAKRATSKAWKMCISFISGF